MADHYPLLLTAHLLCAMTFGGAVIFEVVILESLHRRLPPETMHAVETGIVLRARKLMPWVVGLLFVSGLAMLHVRFPHFAGLGDSTLGRLLTVKVGLAGIVLACFVTALTLFALGGMTPARFTLIHRVVFTCVVSITVLAKAMFFL